MERWLNNLITAWAALQHHRLRSLLTTLGVIFGVASVIAMLAIGKGAEHEILAQLEHTGVNNIVISHKAPEPGENPDEEKQQIRSLGLSVRDYDLLKELLPGVVASTPEVSREARIQRKQTGGHYRVLGIGSDYFAINNLHIKTGRPFTQTELAEGHPVCILGSATAKKFFGGEDAIGKRIKVGSQWLSVRGVLAEKGMPGSALAEIGVNHHDAAVYLPFQTYLLRFQSVSPISRAKVRTMQRNDDEDDEGKKQVPQYNEINRIYLKMEDAGQLRPATQVIGNFLMRRHNNTADFTITVPEDLIRQQQRTRSVFNLVLGIIASISLIVGGIGIMNIMLVSVLERTREIGTRRALGATRLDIVQQFLLETVLVSVAGGMAGIVLGMAISWAVRQLAEIPAQITPLSVLLAFTVSIATGILAGISPARKAAREDPSTALRYE